MACAIENELPWGTSWRWIETFNPRHAPGLPTYHLSLACNHCADAPCMSACPALAYAKDDVIGAVLLDSDKCIGCRYCTWACPYDAPRFDADKGVVSKCTFCHSRQLEGLAPACVTACPTGALTFGEIGALEGDPGIAGFPETDAEPSIRFVPARRGGVSAEDSPDAHAEPTRKTSLPTEAPLVVFTLVVATLAGAMATSSGRALLGLPVFGVLAAAAAVASTLHLGRKGRAWRALLNLRRSWLSREVVLFGFFSVASVVALSPLPAPRWTETVAALLGFALLFAMDRVYAVTRTRGLAYHSAGVLLTGVMVAGLAAGNATVWGGALALKVASCTVRKARFAEEGQSVRPLWTGLRLGSALAASSLLMLAMPRGIVVDGDLAVAGTLLLALGEIVDRSEFYLELDVMTPRGEMGRVWAGTATVVVLALALVAGPLGAQQPVDMGAGFLALPPVPVEGLGRVCITPLYPRGPLVEAGLLVAVRLCLNGTGGCHEEYLLGDGDHWGVVDQRFEEDLAAAAPAGFRLHKGRTLDLETLTGTQPMATDGDPNCCPSGSMTFRLWLDGFVLRLARAKVGG